MTNESQENSPQTEKTDNSEINLSKQRKMYEKQLAEEKAARQQLEERLAAAERSIQDRSKTQVDIDDEEDSEPYVDRRKLKKEFGRFGEQVKQQTKQEIEEAVQKALDMERRSNYLKQNNDFDKVMNQDTIQKFADKYPALAENILRMPDGFERQKLVYENIKALRMDQPEDKKVPIQDKIDANKRAPFYQPSGVGTAPYNSAGADFSESSQKNNFAKMQELKKRLRI